MHGFAAFRERRFLFSLASMALYLNASFKSLSGMLTHSGKSWTMTRTLGRLSADSPGVLTDEVAALSARLYRTGTVVLKQPGCAALFVDVALARNAFIFVLQAMASKNSILGCVESGLAT